MQNVKFNANPKPQILSVATNYSNPIPQDSKDTVSFKGKTTDNNNDNSTSIGQIVKTIIDTVLNAILHITGKKEVQQEPSDNIQQKVSEKQDVSSTVTTDAVADKTLAPIDKAQKEIIELVSSAEKEIQTFAADVQQQAEEIHADAAKRISELVEIAKNNGKNSKGETIGTIEYNFDTNVYALMLKKDDSEVPDAITLDIGTNKVLKGFVRFDDGFRIDINPDVISCNKDGNEFIFNRNKNDELKAYMGFDSNSGIEKTIDFKDGKVTEYSELEVRPASPGNHPKHAIFMDGKLEEYYENVKFVDGVHQFEKGYGKTVGGDWVDLTPKK